MRKFFPLSTALVLLSTQSLSLWPAATFDAFADTATNSLPPVTADLNLPTQPQLNMGNAQLGANLLSSCMNFGSAISQLQSLPQLNGPVSAPAGTFGSTASCGPDTPPDPPSDCLQIEPGGTVDDKLVQLLIGKETAVRSALVCKDGKVEQLKTELGCLNSNAQVLQQEMNGISTAFSQNIQDFQTNVNKYTTVIADRDAQIADVQSKINGDEKKGTPGLKKLQETTRAMVAQMAVDLRSAQAAQQQAKQAARALEEQAQVRIAAEASDCFQNLKSPDFRCTDNSEPVSASAVIECRVDQKQHVQQNQIQTDATTNANATATTQGLSTILDQIAGLTPKNGKIPTNAQDAQSQADQPVDVLSAADIDAQFGAQLSAFDTATGLPVHDFVIKAYGNCFNRAKRSVDNERSRANTELGKAQFLLNQQDEENSKNINTLLQGYSQQFSDVMAGLTGQAIPLNINGCISQSVAPDQQVNCVADAKKNFEGLLSGTTPNAGMTIEIKAASNPQLTFGFSCQGLNGCLTMLQNANDQLGRDRQKYATQKASYILQANQQIMSKSKAFAQQLSVQSNALSQRLNSINAALAGLGISTPVQISPVTPEQLQPDKDGLNQAPQNLTNFIGGLMTPPMLDVKGDSFAGGLAGLAQSAQDDKNKMSQVEQNITQIQRFAVGCRQKLIKDALSGANADLQSVANANCANMPACSGADSLTSAVSNVQQLFGGVAPDTVSSLSSGASRVCNTASFNYDRNRYEKAKATQSSPLCTDPNTKANDQPIVCRDAIALVNNLEGQFGSGAGFSVSAQCSGVSNALAKLQRAKDLKDNSGNQSTQGL